MKYEIGLSETVRALRRSVGVLLFLTAANSASSQVTVESNSVSYQAGQDVYGFGWPIQVVGPWLFVVARHHDPASTLPNRQGVIYVYRRSGDEWRMSQSLASPSLSPRTEFGYQRIACDGNTLVVGDGVDRTDGPFSGQVHVYEESGGLWQHVQSLSSPRPGASVFFGTSVDVHGDNLIAGAPGDSLRGVGAGAAYIFTRDSSGHWGFAQEVFGSNLLGYPFSTVNIHFGGVVALHGSVAAVQSRVYTGVVTVFELTTAGWIEKVDLRRIPIVPEAEFGWYGLDVSSDWIAVGSFLGPMPSHVDFGRVFMFRRDSSVPEGWSAAQELIASNASVNVWGSDGFGASIQIEGRRMIVGARYAKASSAQIPFIGQAYLFEESGGQWTEDRRFSAARIEAEAAHMGFSAFGDAVSLSGGVIAVGDWADVQASGLAGPGRVYIYEEPLGWWHCVGSGLTPQLNVVGTPNSSFGSLTLQLTQLAGSSVCLLAAANVGVATPVGPGSAGLPCLAGPTRRLGTLVPAPGSGGFQSTELNLDVPQLGFLVGETWAFQAWCRVPGGTATSNGVALTFD